MPIKWKRSPRFKPSVILQKIDSVRTVNPQGGASFSGFELEDCLPALESMLEFPAVAAEVDASTLVWRGLAKVGKDLTPGSFLAAVNKELSDRLATKEQAYTLLTAISLRSQDVPKRLVITGTEVRVLSGTYPARFRRSRDTLLREHRVPTPPTPAHYSRVIVKVKAKSPTAAVNKGLRALDIQRALWCLMGNPRMQLAFGRSPFSPINVVRLGSQHTLHLPTGEAATDGAWFEPAFSEAALFRIDKPDIVKKNSRWALRQIISSPYKDRLVASLVRFVRALDERDPSVAFLRLWGALEALTTPDQADYEKVVQRCSFLFKDAAFHRQLLEHLREYRNTSLHAGEESESTRTHCFQLQLYFVNLIWFYVRNARYFRSLDEANSFLDSPADLIDLKRRLQLAHKAVRFGA
jgi:hypothetical protein